MYKTAQIDSYQLPFVGRVECVRLCPVHKGHSALMVQTF